MLWQQYSSSDPSDAKFIYTHTLLPLEIYYIQYKTHEITKDPLKATHKSISVDLGEVLFANVLHLGHSGQPHAEPELVHQNPQAQFNTSLSVVRKTPQHRSSDVYEIRSERECFEDVLSWILATRHDS